MGQRSAGETLARILAAFLKQRVWSQAELARCCGVSVKALRMRLQELIEANVPLASETDHPHVYWNVPRNWFPAGKLLEPRDVALVARLLQRLPPGADRAKALALVLGTSDGRLQRVEDKSDPQILNMVEDAARERRAIEIDYFTTSRGDRSERDISVHRILYGDRVRLVATCHRTNTLKYFRVDEIRRVRPISTPFRAAANSDVDEFVDTSIDGFHASTDSICCSFRVTYPDARWVARNLPNGAISAEPFGDGLRFKTWTAGVEPLARFVVGLGGAAEVETPELQRRVHELALGALEKLKPVRKVNTRSVRLKRATE
jgi:predicted DNA-binding transcriptional regulator YafY